LDHGEADEGRDGSRMPFILAHQLPVAADPREGPFDDPSLGQNLEAKEAGTFDDLQMPRAKALTVQSIGAAGSA